MFHTKWQQCFVILLVGLCKNNHLTAWATPVFTKPKELMFASWLNDLSNRLRVLRAEQLRVVQATVLRF